MIEKANQADQPTLIRQMLAFSQEVGKPLPENHISAAVSPILGDSTLGAILVPENRCGYLVLTNGWSIESGGLELLLDELYIEPGFRNQGFGSALVSAAIELGKELGAKAIFLETEAGNPGARELYLRQGFALEDSSWLTRRI